MFIKKSLQIVQKIPRSYFFFGIFCSLFVILMLYVEVRNGKFWTNDLKVYYEATIDFFNGNNPYTKSYGLDTGYFKYPPSTLYFFLFLSQFTYFTAQVLHSIILLTSLFVSVVTLHKTLQFQEITRKKFSWVLYVAFSFIAIHVVREFHMGNVNLILLVLFVLGLNAFDNKKLVQFAFFWSLMVILKPIVILAFIPILFFKQWKVIGLMIGFGMLFLFLPMVHKGSEGGWNLWMDWFKSISLHGDYIISENSIKYLTNYYIGIDSAWIPSLIGLIILVGIMVWIKIRYEDESTDFREWAALFMAFTPSFFVTDTEHFLLSLPLILIILKKIIQLRVYYYWILFLIVMTPFALKSNDLLGSELAAFANEKGVIGLSNLLVVLLFVLFLVIQKKAIFKST